MSKMTYQEALQWASLHIKDADVDESAPQFVLLNWKNWDLTKLLMHQREEMPQSEWTNFQDTIARLLNHEPAQYIVGQAPFYGRNFLVTSAVLIPESETEELVEWVLSTHDNSEKLRVLDLGTGSGVIGITLKLERPNWTVVATDISEDALSIAKRNAQSLGASVQFSDGDLFDAVDEQPFDLIVTNPPYIAHDEIGEMDESVIRYEPDVALFADKNGLAFYERLFTQVSDHLKTGGQLFAETGYQQRQPIVQLFNQLVPSATIETKNDMSGKMRMIKAFNF